MNWIGICREMFSDALFSLPHDGDKDILAVNNILFPCHQSLVLFPLYSNV